MCKTRLSVNVNKYKMNINILKCRNPILLSILFICFTGCNTGTRTGIVVKTPGNTINPDWVYYIEKNKSYEKKNLILQDVATVDYIKLETTPDGLLDGAVNCKHIELTDNYIFIVINNIISRFDRNGKFLNKIDRIGQGPGEYINIRSITVDYIREEILIYDGPTRRLLKYSYEGKFINSVDINGVVQIGFLGGDTLAYYSSNRKTEPIYSLRSSIDGRILKSFSDINQKVSGMSHYAVKDIENLKKNGGEFFFNTLYSDTIFSVNKDRRVPRYILLPPNNPEKHHEEGNTATPHLICETYSFAALAVLKNNSFTYGNGPIYYVVDKNQNIVYEGSIINSDTDTSFRPFNSISEDNQFVALFEIASLKNYNSKENLGGRLKELYDLSDENDNPILMIATAK